MLKIRKAQLEDSQDIYDLRTDEDVRRFSLNSEIFDYASHQTWFKKSLTSSDRRIFVIQNNERPFIGVVRYDFDTKLKEANVSIFISRSSWGNGVGTFALRESEILIKKEFPFLEKITATVISANVSSMKLFQKVGFEERAVTFIKEVK